MVVGAGAAGAAAATGAEVVAAAVAAVVAVAVSALAIAAAVLAGMVVVVVVVVVAVGRGATSFAATTRVGAIGECGGVLMGEISADEGRTGEAGSANAGCGCWLRLTGVVRRELSGGGRPPLCGEGLPCNGWASGPCTAGREGGGGGGGDCSGGKGCG